MCCTRSSSDCAHNKEQVQGESESQIRQEIAFPSRGIAIGCRRQWVGQRAFGSCVLEEELRENAVLIARYKASWDTFVAWVSIDCVVGR